MIGVDWCMVEIVYFCEVCDLFGGDYYLLMVV